MLCSLCQRYEADGYLCPGCAHATTERLDELPLLYAEAAECLVPRRSGWGDIIATKSGAGPRSPLDEDVLDTVNWVRAAEVVRLWRVDVQRVRWPQHAPPAPASLAADCRWLRMEFDWVSSHYPAAGDLASEVRELEGRARAVVGDPVPKPQQLGTCVAVTDDQGTVCGAVIKRLPGQTRLSCRRCGTVYGPREYLMLKQLQPDAA